MLKVFRENLKYLSWILWIVIAVFILFVFVDFGSGVPRGTDSQAAAWVGDEEISFNEVASAYRQMEESYRESLGGNFTPELARQLQLPLRVLESLVNERVLLDEARRAGLEVTDEELRQAVLEIPSFRSAPGTFVGRETYAQVLRTSGQTPEAFEARLRQQLLIEKLRTVLAQNIFISDQEVGERHREDSERAKIRFVRLAARPFEGEVEVSPAEVEAYFEAHKSDFRIPEQRAVEYLLVDTSRVRERVKVDDAEVRAYYDDNAEEFSQEEQVQARHILVQVNDERTAEAADRTIREARRRIEGGEDFAEVARQVSEDPGSKERGGDLGYFGRGQMAREFEQAAFSATPGALVGPVQTSFGYHLIEVTDRRAGDSEPFEAVSTRIRTRLVAERARSLAETKAKELAQRIRDDGLASAPDFARLDEEDEETILISTEPFGRDDLIPDVGRNAAFAAMAFALETDGISEPLPVARGWAILRLRQVREPRTPALAEVEVEVRRAAIAGRASELAVRRLEAAKREVLAGKSLAEAAEELETEVEESGEFTSSGAIPGLGPNPALAEAALALEAGGIGGPLPHAQGAVLFEVVERKHFDPAELDENREDLREALKAERLNQLLASLVQSRREALEVQYSPELLERLGISTGSAS